MASIKVVGCVRPLTDNSSPRGKSGGTLLERCVSVDEMNSSLTVRDPLSSNKAYSFKLDKVLEGTEPGTCFESVVPLLEGAIEGINASVFAYGALGTGKTRLMLGYDLSSLTARKGIGSRGGNSSPASRKRQPTSDEVAVMMSKTFDTDAGIILRSMKMLLEKKDSLKKAGVCDLKIVVSYFEVCADEMRDLLKAREKSSSLYMHSAIPKSSPMHSPRDNAPDVRIAPDGSTTLSGLIEVEIVSLEDVMHLLWAGARLRSTVAGESNSLLSVNLRVEYLDSNIVRVGKVMFVDLAGAEMISPYEEVTSLRRASSKNKNLTVLGKVLSALQESHSLERRYKRATAVANVGDGGEGVTADASGITLSPLTPESSPGKSPSPSKKPLSQGVVVPYRESKLTRVLTDCLGRRANSLFFCMVSPASSSFQETLRTLQFGESAAKVTVEPTRSTAVSIVAVHSQEGGVVSTAASGALVNENTRLKILSRYLYNALSQVDSTGVSAIAADLKSLQVVEPQQGAEAVVRGLRDSLMLAKNEKAGLEEEVAALRRELEEERKKKRDICQLIYSADVPEVGEDLDINSDDEEETISRKEKQYFHIHGTHRDHQSSTRRRALAVSGDKSGAGEGGRESKGASSTSPPAPPKDKEEVAPLMATKPVLPNGKHVDFAMQAALLEIERQGISRQRASLLEWRKAEDLRWSFVTASVREHKEAVSGAQKEAEASGADGSLEERFEGLKERTKMMELSLQVHEETMRSLQASLNKASTRAQHRASTFYK